MICKNCKLCKTIYSSRIYSSKSYKYKCELFNTYILPDEICIINCDTCEYNIDNNTANQHCNLFKSSTVMLSECINIYAKHKIDCLQEEISSLKRNSKLYTREEIAKMDSEKFLEVQNIIIEQMQKGLIK